MFEAVLRLSFFIALLLIVVLGRPQLDVLFTDDRQVEMLRESSEHHIVVPYSVDRHGNYLSHDLHHHRKRRSLSSEEESDIHYHIPFKNEKLHLTLSRNNDLVLPGMKVEWRSGKNTTPPTDCYFIGALKNHTESSAAISTCKGLAGMIRGSNHGEYFIEPVYGVDVKKHGGKHPHVMYQRSVGMEHNKEGENNTEPTCGVTVDDVKGNDVEKPTKTPAAHRGFYLKRRQRRSVSLMKHVEALLVADNTMKEYYGNRDLEHYLLTIMNMVKLIFKHRSIGSAINVVLVRMVILDKDQEEGLNITNHARKTLNQFCSWVNKVNPVSDHHPQHADTAILVTKRNICRHSFKSCKTLGLANVDGMCLRSNGCSYNEDSGFPLVYTIAHELAHSLGSLHDEDYSTCYKMRNHIMASNLVTNPNSNLWSRCTKKAVKSFFYKGSGWCLNDQPGRDLQPIKRYVLPGEEFSADQQCATSYGLNSTRCEEPGYNSCHNLWCIVKHPVLDYCTTSFHDYPALDGTPCGKTKWCIKGQCKLRSVLRRPVDGDWGPWSRWSACSSTCGRGVRRKTRRCNSPKPEYGGNYCVGEWKKYTICNLRHCYVTTTNSNCKKFRTLLINGKKYDWTLIKDHDHPCEHRCEPIVKKGHSRIRKYIQAKDGASCNNETLNICIQGKCEHVGCDNKLYSSAREDRCGVCRGDGSSCVTRRVTFNKTKGNGYTEAMVIPAGSRNIVIREVSASPNFLALKSSTGKYYLNGNWYIEWEGKYDVGGVDGFYSRRHNKEMFVAKGPLKRNLHVVLLYQTNNPGLNIQYDVKLKGKVVKRWFSWKSSTWSRCSVTCGQGIRKRTTSCVDEGRHVVDNQHCRGRRPTTTMTCNPRDCPPSWWVGLWSECSKTCGPGVRFRPVLCTQVIKDQRRIQPHSKCEGKKPNKLSTCKQPLCWVTNAWTKCSAQCGSGNQTRQIRCPGAVSQCSLATRPVTNRTCIGTQCLDWNTGPWGNCTKPCGDGYRLRKVVCKHTDDSRCDWRTKPSVYQPCPGYECPAWTIGNWTECSVTCGKGVQRRNVTCQYRSTTIPCDVSRRPLAKRSCMQKRCSGWVVGKWGECSTTCGKGLRERKVVCTFKTCPVSTRPLHRKTCNARDCPKWNSGPWSECSASCGNGTRHRNVTCSASGVSCSASDVTCLGADVTCPEDAKPLTVEDCVETECSMWRIGNWSDCSVYCGDGIQTRSVECNTTVPSLCEQNVAPTSERTCSMGDCEEWRTSPWSDCSITCGTGLQNRTVFCPGSRCDPLLRPNTTRVCNNENCSVWVTGLWGECLSECSEGVQARQVYCSHDNESECDPFLKPESTRDCLVSPCSAWTVTLWSACSATCGTGVKTRNVTCTKLGGKLCSPKPKAVEVCVDAPCRVQWNAGKWSPCSVTCGTGVHYRIVSCIGERCDTSNKPASTKACVRSECVEWKVGNWTECSATCGEGAQTRDVTCGHVTGMCDNDNRPATNRTCRNQTCPFWAAEPWSDCSTTCGNGTQTRNVSCMTITTACGNSTKPVTRRACFSANCGSPWVTGNWSVCSVSCGNGTMARTVSCKTGANCSSMEGKPIEMKPCVQDACAQSWLIGSWTSCSKTCGQNRGIQQRNVTCNHTHVCSNLTKPSIIRPCRALPCPRWLVGKWSGCSKTCGGGIRTRTVACTNDRVGNCTLKIKPATTKPCETELPCPRWLSSKWSECSKTCGGGIRTRTVACANNDVGNCTSRSKPRRRALCAMMPCPRWAVGKWGACSVTCGEGGSQSRAVYCKNNYVGKCIPVEKPEKVRECGASPCPHWSVSEWSQCSITCGDNGMQTRTVVCNNSHVGECQKKSKPETKKRCGELPCPEWSAGEWSKCSKTCDGGTDTRTVTCRNSQVGNCLKKDQPEKSRSCSELPCPEWSADEWSKCSKTCGGGTQTRTVTCKNNHVSECPTENKPETKKRCSELPCPEWSAGEWSKCSKTCDGGTQTRTVTCKNNQVGECLKQDKPHKSRVCGELPCPEWSAGEWSKCSKTCDGGTQTRTVTCKNNQVGECLKQDKPHKSRVCGELPCPEWSAGEWSKCSKTCGGGTQTRSVICKNGYVGRCSEKDKPKNTNSCSDVPCPEWTNSEWRKCSKTCGGGIRTRNITCKNSHVGECLKKDKPIETHTCGELPCPEWSAGEWSKCSKTCGGGIQTRSITCNNSHVGECLEDDKPIDTQKCDELPCPEWFVSKWSKCSKTCGSGTQTRTVTCRNSQVGNCPIMDQPKKSRSCSELPCPEWSADEWSKCSKTCDGGTQTRTVICKNSQVGNCLKKDQPERSRSCSELPCPEWAADEWGKCSKTCGGGTQTRTVACKNSQVGECLKKDQPEKSRSCSELPCPEWAADEWGKCSKTCGGGTQTRTVACKNSQVGECLKKDQPEKSRSCSELPCPEWAAGNWSKCSKTCGGGTQTRTVTCKNNDVGQCFKDDKPVDTLKCGALPCPEWSAGGWSKCSTTCGGGTQTRTVTCRNSHVGDCLEESKPQKTKPCGELPCPEWSSGEWSKCSTTCGGGTQTRTVTCKNNHIGECLRKDKPKNINRCSDVPCPEWTFSGWSKCSKTCGGGIRTRNLTCKNSHVGECLEKNKPIETHTCGVLPCPEWSAGKWSKCSKTCGGGTQTRAVTCNNSHVGECFEDDKPIATNKCGELPCPEWSAGKWSKCSKTCDGGTQTRTVTCRNSQVGNCLEKGQPERSRSCSELPCPEWVADEWGKCSKTCDGGTQTRAVTCRNSQVGNCLKKDQLEKSRSCSELPCPEWTFSEWSKCSKTCDGGTQTRTVTCRNSQVGDCLEKSKPRITKPCGELPCPEWSTDEWSKCSKTCGGGTQTRTVTCRNSQVGNCLEKDQPEKSRSCSELPCPEWTFSEWSKCSKTCDGGTQTRTVTCRNSQVGNCLKKDQPEKSRSCSELPCPEWVADEWGKCSKTCDGGTQTRAVTCRNSQVGNCLKKDQLEKSRSCSELPCPEWTFSEWSKCSKTCDGGTQTRTVTCRNSQVGDCLEKSKPRITKPCGELPCPEWSTDEWSKCSKTCGGGTQTRTVTCRNSQVGNCLEKDQPEKSRSCSELPCPEWTFSEWSKCSKTCDGGTQTRTVTCRNSQVGNCLKKDQPEKSRSCSKLPCPEWTFSEWSKCSKTCDGGTQTRTVTCRNSHVGDCLEKSKPRITKPCGELPCPEWSADEWSKCSKTCDGGTQTRTVTCRNSQVGNCLEKDQPEKSRSCSELPCPEWTFSEWSKCSKTCDGGTQTRTVTCRNSHVGDCLEKSKPRITKPCGELLCPEWSADEWSKCSKTCDGGTQTRTVTCRNSQVGNCLEKDQPEKSRSCSELPCPEWTFSEWSKCSRTCDGGTQTRTVTCRNSQVGNCLEKDKPEKSRSCSELPCPKWTFSEWSKCSKTCDGGTQTRTVTCRNSQVGNCLEKDKPEKSRSCSELPCPKWTFSEWSKCSKTCDGGTQTRTVTCRNSQVGNCLEKDKPEKSRSCSELPCPKWTFSEWSKCSKTCDGGTQTRTVTCRNSQVGNCLEKDKPEKSRSCSELPCPKWTFSEWSKCSKTCDGGTQTRTVTCRNSQVGNCLEKDKPEKSRSCSELPCPKWTFSEWSKCSKTCGGGERVRRVWCSSSGSMPCSGQEPVRRESCNPESCAVWVTEPWSACIVKICGRGKQLRTVKCTGARRSDCKGKKPDNRKQCKVVCPEWRTSKWSKCDGPCETSKIQRRVWCEGDYRKCKRHKKKPKETMPCLLERCLTWSVGPWNACPKTCGGGIRGRSVRCVNSGTGHSMRGCNKDLEPPKLQACALTECPDMQDKTPILPSTPCGQAKKGDTFFCNLLLEASLSQLCEFQRWQTRCCDNCKKVLKDGASLSGRLR